MSIPNDLWKVIIEYINDGNLGGGFGSILPYREINKSFRNIILECVKEVRIQYSNQWIVSLPSSNPVNSVLRRMNILLSRPQSLQKLNIITSKISLSEKKDFYDLICDCKELRCLLIDFLDTALSSIDSIGLQRVGNTCRNIEELSVGARRGSSLLKNLSSIPSHLSSFHNLRKLSIEGVLWSAPVWAHAISTLPNLKGIKWDLINDQIIIDFCKLCEEKPITKTLEMLDFSDEFKRNNMFKRNNVTDDGLYSVLYTFTNLTDINFSDTDIALATIEIMQKLGSLNKLKISNLNGTKLFFNGDASVIRGWLQTALPYFPNSLETLQCIGCRALIGAEFTGLLGLSLSYGLSNTVPMTLISQFRSALPNLKEISITFDIHHLNNDDDDDDYDDDVDSYDNHDGYSDDDNDDEDDDHEETLSDYGYEYGDDGSLFLHGMYINDGDD
jgi:hypothetical protein